MRARAHIAAILILSTIVFSPLQALNVIIPDAGLEAALRSALGKTTGTLTDVASLVAEPFGNQRSIVDSPKLVGQHISPWWTARIFYASSNEISFLPKSKEGIRSVGEGL